MREEPIRLTVDARDPHFLPEMHRRCQKPMHQEFRQRVCHADDDPHRHASGMPGDRILQLASQREDLVSIPVDQLACFGQPDRTASPLEEPRLKRLLQLTNLTTHGRLREVQLLAGLGDAALASGRPEVQQVMVVKPAHARLTPFVASLHRTSRRLVGLCRFSIVCGPRKSRPAARHPEDPERGDRHVSDRPISPAIIHRYFRCFALESSASLARHSGLEARPTRVESWLHGRGSHDCRIGLLPRLLLIVSFLVFSFLASQDLLTHRNSRNNPVRLD